jgi:hypothetical protein
MNICSQCASPTNRSVKVNGHDICQECSEKINPVPKLSPCCNAKVYFNHATGDYCCSICTDRIAGSH